MEIGPVNAIRPIAMVRPSTSAPDLAGVFAIEFREQQREDTYSSGNPSRGLEDENGDDENAPAEVSPASGDEIPTGSISFFA